jgi:hypothetical protein
MGRTGFVNSRFQVNVVTAFGRAETLALALETAGFAVQVLDFTSAFGPEWQRGAGPFPLVKKEFTPAQAPLLGEARTLERGLVLWLKDGPVELGGSMRDFFTSQNKAVCDLRAKGNFGASFEDSWLRRYVNILAAPYFNESWEGGSSRSAFPFDGSPLSVLPASLESRVMSFERYQTLDHDYLAASGMHDVQFDGSRLVELEVDKGSPVAVRADQWVWCLSSEETARLGAKVASALFPRGVVTPEWRWVGFQGRAARGPWSAGFPEYMNVIGDLHLPWTYANNLILKWIDPDLFHVWMMVPSESAFKPERLAGWAAEAEALLRSRLNLAEWKITAEKSWICPNSPVFPGENQSDSQPSWKNWDWIAPEALPRLDLSARLEREAKSLERLTAWKNEQLKKQGARGDHALHAP